MLIFTIILLATVLIGLIAYLIYYKRQIKNIGDQLEFILDNQSFKFIQSQIRPLEITKLIELCNTTLENQRTIQRNFSSRNEVINQTIVSLSHDIRTPLTSLDGYLQLAQESDDDKNQTKYIEMAQSRIKQINTLVDELFLYTKLQNPDYELELEPVDITNHIQNHLFKFIQQFTVHDREPIINVLNHSIKINANEHALERVIENIINNYFIHGTGDLTVKSIESQHEITFSFMNPTTNANSIDINNIFTQFYKDDQSRARQSSGLGLSIVRSLMHKMNGTVSATMEHEQFTIKLTFPKL